MAAHPTRRTVLAARHDPKPTSAEPTAAEIREGLIFAAYLVERYGEVYAPILDRLERELAAAPTEAPRDRARRILEAHTVAAGMIPHRPAPS